jgi:hypothetical protein
LIELSLEMEFGMVEDEAAEVLGRSFSLIDYFQALHIFLFFGIY